MELAQLEAMRNQAVQSVIMQEKMVEQAKAKVANIEGRIAERKEILAEAEKAKKEKVIADVNKKIDKAKPKPTKEATDKIAKDIAEKASKKS